MSGRGKNRHNRQRLTPLSRVSKTAAVSLPADSPVLAMFKDAALMLNERQDRHERLVKLSRDITIESKRIIFLLHSAITEESSEAVIKEANERLQKLTNGPIKSIGLELQNSPANLHSRAVTSGFQEYIEARTYFSLMESKTIIPFANVQKEFNYMIKDGDEERSITTLLPKMDYILGIADLTGELMRKAINSISSGDSEECFHACQVVRYLYTGYLGLSGMGKPLARKMSTTRANVSKVEHAVYTLRVRGGEAPPLLLLSGKPEWEAAQHSDDEGYY